MDNTKGMDMLNENQTSRSPVDVFRDLCEQGQRNPMTEDEVDNFISEVRAERLSNRIKGLSEAELVKELTDSIKNSDTGHTHSAREVSEEMRAKYERGRIWRMKQ